MSARNPELAAARTEWMNTALVAVADLARTGRVFQCHDVVLLRGVPEPPTYRLWGRLMTTAREQGIVVPVAATPSSRPKTARSLVRLWVGAQHAQGDQ